MSSRSSEQAAAGPRVLVVTENPDTLDDLVRLAAAAGAEVEVASSGATARGSWARAPLVLVCDDAAAGVLASGFPRRRDVVLVTARAGGGEMWRQAVGLGAEHVAVLPEAEPWLVDRLADAVAGPSRDARVIAMVGGRGGAGASTLAAAVAVSATQQGARVLLVDADPLGGGIDLVLGAEDVAGLRWPDLAHTQGRVAPTALDDALPRAQALTVLSWDRGDVLEVPAGAMAAVLDAGVRGFDLVVADLPRQPDPAAAQVLSRTFATYLVVPREVRAVASSARVASTLASHTATVQVVARGPAPTGLDARTVADSLGLPLALQMRAEPRLPVRLDQGEPLRARGPLADAARILVAAILDSRPQAA